MVSFILFEYSKCDERQLEFESLTLSCMLLFLILFLFLCLDRYGAVVMDDQYDDGSLGYIVLHNCSCQHAAPTFINLMNSAILRLASNDKNMTIQMRNHPLPMTKSQRLQHHVCFSLHININNPATYHNKSCYKCSKDISMWLHF